MEFSSENRFEITLNITVTLITSHNAGLVSTCDEMTFPTLTPNHPPSPPPSPAGSVYTLQVGAWTRSTLDSDRIVRTRPSNVFESVEASAWSLQTPEIYPVFLLQTWDYWDFCSFLMFDEVMWTWTWSDALWSFSDTWLGDLLIAGMIWCRRLLQCKIQHEPHIIQRKSLRSQSQCSSLRIKLLFLLGFQHHANRSRRVQLISENDDGFIYERCVQMKRWESRVECCRIMRDEAKVKSHFTSVRTALWVM